MRAQRAHLHRRDGLGSARKIARADHELLADRDVCRSNAGDQAANDDEGGSVSRFSDGVRDAADQLEA